MRRLLLTFMYILMIAQMVSAQSELLRVNKQRHFPVILPGNYSGITHIRGDEYAVVGINIPESSDEIRTNVKESIKKVTGIDVKEMELFIKQIKAKEE